MFRGLWVLTALSRLSWVLGLQRDKAVAGCSEVVLCEYISLEGKEFRVLKSMLKAFWPKMF